MSLRSVRITLIVLAIAAFLFIGFMAWIFGTPQGAGQLLAAASDLTSLEISTARIEGRLWNGIRLNGLKIKWGEGYLTMDDFYLRWQPFQLLIGNVAVREVFIKNLVIQDNSKEKETDLRWPEVTGLPSKLDGWIDSLKVENLSLRKQDKDPVAVRKISSALIWHDMRLTLRDFSITSAQADAAGTLAAGFRKAFLYADIRVHPSSPVRGMTAFLAKMNLSAAAEPLQMRGPFSITGTDGAKDRMNLKGEIGLKRYGFMIEKLVLTESDRRGSVTGGGEIDLRPEEPELTASLELHDLDLWPELKTATHLEGLMTVKGNAADYTGTLKLSNSGERWRAAKLSGAFSGDSTGIRFELEEGLWMQGSLQGEMKGSWERGTSVSAHLKARNIDPASFEAGWSGQINFDISANLDFPQEGSASGELSAEILNSSLRGRSLKGEVKMNLRGDNLIVKNLFLRGKGFDISAKGELRKRLTFLADVTDLSGLVPEAKGTLRAEGWIGLEERLRLAGTIHGRKLSFRGLAVNLADLETRFHTDERPPIRLAGKFEGIRYGDVTIRSAQALISGSEKQHILRLSMDSNRWNLQTQISGAYQDKMWDGKIIELYGRDAVGAFKIVKPASVLASPKGISIADFYIEGEGLEQLQLSLNVNLEPQSGVLYTDWTGLNLARAGQLMKHITLQGRTSGKINASWAERNLSSLSGTVEASGVLGVEDQRIEIEQSSLDIDWKKNNVAALFEMRMEKHGMIKGKILFAQPLQLGLPDRADIDIDLSGMDTTVLKPWLPEEIDLKGKLSAQIQGELLPDKRTEISGSVKLSEGMLLHTTQKSELRGELKNAQITFLWQGDRLNGDLELALADYGRLSGNFSLPMPARLPISLMKDKPLDVSIKGTAREQGILTSLFPGLVQESQGKLNLDLTVSGSWNRPDYSGEAVLTDAGAYLPPAGITLKDVTANARFNQNRIVIETFSARSGEGKIEGNAEIEIKQFSITEYEGKITGEDFRAIYLPDLQASVSPNLTFQGRRNSASLNGEIKVTELFIYGSEKEVVAPSRDVVIIDASKKEARETPLHLDIDVRVILGDKVFVKMEGIDARLKGKVDLKAKGLDDIKGTGTIEVAKGKYNRYGIDLDIKRGKIVFAGGPADNPSLDVLAVREIDDVKAGVLATGTLKSPKVNLYSEPPMPDTDILSYIVLGHPPGADSEQIGLLSRAAGLLLSGGESATLQAKLQQRLGIDVLDIESGGGEIERSAVTVGKYLSPKLYVGYGVSLFTGENIMRLKYKLSKRFELQTESGLETGIDLFYKIQFR